MKMNRIMALKEGMFRFLYIYIYIVICYLWYRSLTYSPIAHEAVKPGLSIPKD